MIVLGVDPGSRNTGYGVIRTAPDGYAVLGCGVIRMKSSTPLTERIGMIWKGLEEVVAVTMPDALAIETAFVGRNVRSALILGQVRGAVLAFAAMNGLPVREYAPREVKSAVTGSGSAGKEQVAEMLTRLLGLGTTVLPADVTDALGISYCDLSRSICAAGALTPARLGKRQKKGKGWSAFVDDHPELVA